MIHGNTACELLDKENDENVAREENGESEKSRKRRGPTIRFRFFHLLTSWWRVAARVIRETCLTRSAIRLGAAQGWLDGLETKNFQLLQHISRINLHFQFNFGKDK